MTKAAIGCFTVDNTITAILCEEEGFIDGIGLTLVKHYSSSWEDVEELLAGGHIINLGDTPYNTYYTGNYETFQYDSEKDFIEHATELGCEYIYLFLEELDINQPAMWHVARPGTDFIPIVDRMMDEEENYLQGVA